MAGNNTEASLECVTHDTQGVDSGPAICQAHSSPPSTTECTFVQSNPGPVQADNQVSPHVTVANPESSSAVNQNESQHSADATDDGISPKTTKFGESSDVAVVEAISEINEGDDSSNVTVVNAESSLPAAEPVDVLRFSDLSPELRNSIYQFVLGPPEDPSTCLTQILDDSPIRAPNGRVDFGRTFRVKSMVHNPKHQDPKWGVGHHVQPQDLSILLVSKQMYAESFHVFYATNCLSFTNTGLLYRFLKNIGHARRQHLTMIYFLWRGPNAKEAFRLLKTCRRLTRVEFTVPCSHPPGYEALKEVRVETAKARALIHFAPAQLPPLHVRSHTSCFGDYECHCLCRRDYEPASRLRELEKAMMRPRRPEDLPDPEETFDLFTPKRECFKKSEDQDLLEDKASFNDFTSRMDKQGRALKHVGRRDKAEEATLNQTLTGSAADDYFKNFEAKLAAERKYLKMEERWYAKRRAEQERELRRRTAREAKERKKMMAQAAKAQKKATRESSGRDKKRSKGTMTA